MRLRVEWFVRVWVVRVVFDSQQPFLEGREDVDLKELAQRILDEMEDAYECPVCLCGDMDVHIEDDVRVMTCQMCEHSSGASKWLVRVVPAEHSEDVVELCRMVLDT